MTNIICMDCEQAMPLADECLPLREGFLAKQQGFLPSKMNLRIEASCEELRKSGACEPAEEARVSFRDVGPDLVRAFWE